LLSAYSEGGAGTYTYSGADAWTGPY